MSAQARASPPRRTATDRSTDRPPPGRVSAEEAGDWLDEIDSVLEENACEVLRNYQQKPGE